MSQSSLEKLALSMEMSGRLNDPQRQTTSAVTKIGEDCTSATPRSGRGELKTTRLRNAPTMNCLGQALQRRGLAVKAVQPSGIHAKHSRRYMATHARSRTK